MTYIVIELQTTTTTANIATAYTDRNQAEQKFHTILAAAAVSQIPVHAAVMLTSDGRMLASGCYRHGEEEPEE